VNWADRAGERIGRLTEEDQARRVRAFDSKGVRGTLGGREIVSFASNDYLGLSQHPRVVAAAHEALDRWGTGAGSARLIVGGRAIHDELETDLARWKEEEGALLFPSGYSAGLGTLTAFGTKGTTILSDELNHASLVDGCRLSRADVLVYPHREMDALEGLLSRSESPIVVSDLVFSMDGDIAPVADLVSLCSDHDALLVLDEAHAVLGPSVPSGSGDRIRLGTLSKFLGSAGGFAAASRSLVDLMVNVARPFIFTTAGSPADAAAALAALRIVRSDEGEALRTRLRALIDRLRPGHPSPIIPIVLGASRDAMAASERLLELGFLVPAIRPPSVAEGSARLRVTLSAAHQEEEVEELALALEKVTGTTIDG
jgi:8-amino-7-oxononanoate synthase